MFKKKKYIAVILARGGSKRLPKKNLKNLKGKPLIAYTILSALKCKYIDEIIVSSDDEKISKLSKKYGVKIVKRPKYLSGDYAKSSDALIHVLKDNLTFDYVILLQPTSPLRNEKHISAAIRILEKKRADALISVYKDKANPNWSNFLPKNFSMENFFKKKSLDKKNYNFNNYYRLNGAIYICKINKFLKEKSFFLKKNIYAFEMSQEESIDIDTEFDFKIAKALMKN